MSRGLLRAMFRPYVELDFTRMVFDTRVSFSRSSTATRFRADKVLETVASNTPRIDHDPLTGAVRGLLLEEQRTNLLLNSTLAGGGDPPTGWTRVIGTGTSAPAASIYGSADGAAAYSQAATAQRPFYERAVTTTIGAVYTLSLRVEAASGVRYIDILGVNGVTPSVVRRNGAVVLTTSAAQPGLLELVFTAIGTSSGIRVGIGVSGSATGTATFSRPQIEAGSFATSYIPTTTATVTRAADVASFTIPASVVRLVTIYYDGTTASQTVTPGATYTIPTGTKQILRIRGYYA